MLYENVYTMTGAMVRDYVLRILCRHVIMFGSVLIAAGVGMMIYVGGFHPLFFSVMFTGICCAVFLPMLILTQYKKALMGSEKTRIRFRNSCSRSFLPSDIVHPPAFCIGKAPGQVPSMADLI